MGWWKDGDDLLGDGPADLFQEGMTEFGTEHSKPGWQQVLDALDAALDAGRLRAEFKSETPSLQSEPEGAMPELRETLRNLLDQVREEYQEKRERQPTVSELLGTVQFSLGGRPESFLAAPAPKLKSLGLAKAE